MKQVKILSPTPINVSNIANIKEFASKTSFNIKGLLNSQHYMNDCGAIKKYHSRLKENNDDVLAGLN